MSFEFERSGCIEIYSALIAAGLELSHDSHHRLTDLCQCTRNLREPMPGETVAVALEVLARAQAKCAWAAVEQLEIA